jgi:ubiquinone/menaquinone biosynthesis C-methylase UbiE
MNKIVTAKEHYDMLIDEGNDPYRDNEILKAYMSRWDGPKFFECLGTTKDKKILEVGVGTGRVAKKVLDMGYAHFTGIDLSEKTVNRAQENLGREFPDIELLVSNIEEFKRPNFYDIIYSVLTFLHIENQLKALTNIVDSLKVGGTVVLSISVHNGEWLDYGRKIKIFPYETEFYTKYLEQLNCTVIDVIDLVDNFVLPNGHKQPEYGQKIATIIKATKSH